MPPYETRSARSTHSTRRTRNHPPSDTEDEQSRTHTQPVRAGSRAGPKSQAKRSNTTSNTGCSKSKSVRVRAPGDAEDAAEAARLRAQVIALQEQLVVEQARKDAEAEKQREEKARKKHDAREEDDDYDIVLDAALTVNARNQCNRSFPIQSRSSCDLGALIDLNTTPICEPRCHFILYHPAVPKQNLF